MPISAVLACRVDRDAAFPIGIGRAVHAWVLGQFAQEDADVAGKLHDAADIKPITVSPLRGAVERSTVGLMHASAGASVWLRLTAFNGEVEHLLADCASRAVGGPIDIAGIRLTVRRAHTAPDQHPWAARSTYEELFQAAVNDDAPTVLTLHFGSPTTFRSREGNLPFPLPRLVFRTLVQKWNRFSPIDLGQFLPAIEEGVRVQRYRCETHFTRLDRHGEVGFTGTVDFDLRRLKDPLLRKVVAALGRFALFAGVGAKTTMGFGQVRPVPQGGR